MKHIFSLVFFILGAAIICYGQKVPLDHSVYDSWQDIGKMDISPDGGYVYYEVNVQKGDGMLYLQTAQGDTILQVPRGERGWFSKDNHYFVCKIAGPYKEEDKEVEKEEAKTAGKQVVKEKGNIIEKENQGRTKEKQDPQARKITEDSLFVFDIAKRRGVKFANLDHFKMAGHGLQYVVWLSGVRDTLETNSRKRADSALKISKQDDGKKTGKKGSDKEFVLNVLKLGTDTPDTFAHVKVFSSDTTADYIAFVRLEGPKLDSQSISYLNLQTGKRDIIFAKAKEIKSAALSENASSPAIAFITSGVRHEDTLSRQNDIHVWRKGIGTQIAVEYNQKTLPKNWEISPYTDLEFSRSGQRLFFKIAPGKSVKGSSEGDVSLDIWNTRSEMLFTEHKINADRLSKRGYLAAYFLDSHKVLQVEDSVFSDAIKTFKGDGDYFYLSTDTSRRIDKQWLGYTLKDYYVLNMHTGEKSEVVSNLNGRLYPSYNGVFALFYDREKRQYAIFNAGNQIINKVSTIRVPLYDEQYDRADAPPNYGVMGWDTARRSPTVYVYDRYDIWRIDCHTLMSTLVNVSGRNNKIQIRIQDPLQERGPYYFNGNAQMDFNCYYEDTKNNKFIRFALNHPKDIEQISPLSDYKVSDLKNALDNTGKSIYTIENYQSSPQVYIRTGKGAQQLSDINKQQSHYLWGSAKLFKWKAPTGKLTEGIVYLPENLDTTKKYPMITYFYERRNETLYNYIAPKPTGSALNISFFVSRGYVVFIPDIWYTTGHPGQSAYDYVLSGIKSLEEVFPFIDSTNLGVQGQSWGGYQVAYLVTRTNMFKAAWAGAPVVDMFSAYGGIRWKTGSSRAMQYERGQSRIGVTPWENKGLYIENSPLFFIPKIETPLVIMSNDGDGAVPWYQGIEFFMALRRFGKQAWLLNYRGEEHNLIKRENKEDIQRKEAAYFDWQLKGGPRPAWTY